MKYFCYIIAHSFIRFPREDGARNSSSLQFTYHYMSFYSFRAKLITIICCRKLELSLYYNYIIITLNYPQDFLFIIYAQIKSFTHIQSHMKLIIIQFFFHFKTHMILFVDTPWKSQTVHYEGYLSTWAQH